MKQITSIKNFLFSILLLLNTSLFAEVSIIGLEIPGLHQNDGEGVYDKIVNQTVVRKRLANLNVYPPTRAEELFETCKNCCLTPANKNPEFYDFPSPIVETDPMNTAKIYIFVKQGAKVISKLKDLKGKEVGIRRGMPYGKSFERSKLNTHSVNTIEKNIFLTLTNRLDAFIAYVPDAYYAFRNVRVEPFPHEVSKPLAVHPDRLVCKGVSVEFINQFNKLLGDLRNSNELKKILGDNYIPE